MSLLLSFFLSTTIVDDLRINFISDYEKIIEYGKITGYFIGIAGVSVAVLKSSRN